MPIIKRQSVESDRSGPGLDRRAMVNTAHGSGHLEIGVLTIAPGGEVRRHTHPVHEEAMYILEGPLEYVLGDDRGIVHTGDMVLAPTGVPHGLSNTGSTPRRIIYIFPTTNVQRVFL